MDALGEPRTGIAESVRSDISIKPATDTLSGGAMVAVWGAVGGVADGGGKIPVGRAFVEETRECGCVLITMDDGTGGGPR